MASIVLPQILADLKAALVNRTTQKNGLTVHITKLQAEVTGAQAKLASLTAEINDINSEITNLQTRIAAGQ